jgi:hypothetical protein
MPKCLNLQESCHQILKKGEELFKAIQCWNKSDFLKRYTKPNQIKQSRFRKIVCFGFFYGYRYESIDILFLFLHVPKKYTCSSCKEEFCSSRYNYMQHA